MYCKQLLTIHKEELIVDTGDLKAKWNKVRGNVQRQWGKLTNDDMDIIDGDTNILVGKLQERYDINEEEARKRVEEFKL